MCIRVLLVDDHTVLRRALRVVLAQEPDIDVVADADCGAAAVRLATELKPDVVVMDIRMPGMDGIETTRQLVAAAPGIKVLALSTHLERYYVMQMLDAGGRGYLAKTADTEELVRAIRALARNQTFFGAEIASKMVDSMRHRESDTESEHRPLSHREREVLALLARGKTSAEIASKLHIAASTVVAHRRNIGRKLGLHSVAELTKYAIREGLTSS